MLISIHELWFSFNLTIWHLKNGNIIINSWTDLALMSQNVVAYASTSWLPLRTLVVQDGSAHITQISTQFYTTSGNFILFHVTGLDRRGCMLYLDQWMEGYSGNGLMLPYLFFLLSTLPASSSSSLLIHPPPHTIDILSPSEKTVIVSETESVPTESATVPPSDSAPSEVSEVVGVMDQGTPSQSKA